MGFKIYPGAGGTRFVGEEGFGEVVSRISLASGCSITRHAADQEAAALLHSIGQHTQAEVIELHNAGVPGYGPANPVNGTTHNRYNDGRAYAFWPWGFRLPKWARGIDCNVGARDRFCEEARKEGLTITVTYPGAVGEAQHVNCRKQPHVSIWLISPVKLWSRGPRARQVMKLLHKVVDPSEGHPYFRPAGGKIPWKFGHGAVEATKAFQKDHLQTPDGVVGPHTIRVLKAAKRHQALQAKGR